MTGLLWLALSGCALLSQADRDAFFDPDADGVPWPQDCDDSDPRVLWGATYYVDADGDGWGDPDAKQDACADADGFADIGRDCDDNDATTNPSAVERCDPDDVDEDCDGLPDDLDAEGALGRTTWFIDGDGDGFGDTHDPGSFSCDARASDVDNREDCDDANATRNPNTPWYADVDGDGFGDPNTVVHACERPAGMLADDRDCDDRDNAIHPGGQERCDDVDDDEDCDGESDDRDDDAVGQSSYFVDEDADGYGSTVAQSLCDPPTAMSDTSTDCDDEDAAIHPNAREYPNAVDDNCDGFVDVCGLMTRRVPTDDATIEAAVLASCDGDVVFVEAGTWPTTVTITKTITLDGPDARLVPRDPAQPIITASRGQYRGFTIADAEVGAIFVTKGSGVQFDDVRFENNTGTLGGGLSLDNSTFTELVDCEFVGNEATRGGGLYAAYSDELVVRRTSFTTNTAEDGGGAYVWQSAWTTFTDDTFEANDASSDGGGLMLDSYQANTHVERSTFTGNSATSRGAAIMNHYSKGTVFEDLEIDANVGTSAVESTYFDLSVDRCVFTNNTAYGLVTGSSDLTVRETAFDSNGKRGASISANLWPGTAVFEDDLFVGNGEPFDIGGPAVELRRLSFANNKHAVIPDLFARGDTVSLDDVQFAESTPTANYASAALIDTARVVTLRDVVVRDTTLHGVKVVAQNLDVQGFVAMGCGGSGLYANISNTLTVDHATLIANGGAGILVAGTGTAAIRHALFVGNKRPIDGPASTQVEWCDSFGNLGPGTGGVSTSACSAVDPHFQTWNRNLDRTRVDLHLAATSPLRDAGDPAAQDGDGSPPDLGAYGGAAFGHAAYFADVDNDGLYDGWERRHGLDPALDDATLDRDGDGVTNGDEFALGTFPEIPDTDNDGKSDAQERTDGTDPIDPFEP